MSPSPKLLTRNGLLPALLAGLGLGLAGCASMSAHPPAVAAGTQLKAKLVAGAGWKTPALRHAYGAPVVLMTPAEIPRKLARTPIDLELNRRAQLADLAAALGQMHIPVLVQGGETASQPIGIPYFHGTLGQLLRAVSRLQNVFFIWDGSALIVKPTAEFTASVPQVKGLVAQVSQVLGKMGAHGISTSQEAGAVHFTAAPDTIPAIKEYLASLNRNAALISIRVAILNVQMNSAQDRGVNWGALEAAASTAALGSPLSSLVSGLPSSSGGGFSPVPGGAPSPQPSSGTNPYGASPYGGSPGGSPYGGSPYGGRPYGGASGTAAASATPNGATIALTGSGAQLTFNAPSFSFSGMVQFLDTYGKTSTLQNTLVRTLGGTPVDLDSGTEVPYVTGIGIGGVGGAAPGGYGSPVGLAQTSTANAGLKLKLQPDYNYRTGLVTITVKLSLESVLGFNQLSAGSQLGSMTQPTTQKESLTDVVPMLPGQSAIIGGLRYKTLSNNQQGIPWLDKHGMASNNKQIDDEEMIIVLRPTVTVYDKPIPPGVSAAPIVVNGTPMLKITHG